jgi:hypothetical protein
MQTIEIVVTVFLLVVLFEIALAAYFVRRTLLHSQVSSERTMNMV